MFYKSILIKYIKLNTQFLLYCQILTSSPHMKTDTNKCWSFALTSLPPH